MGSRLDRKITILSLDVQDAAKILCEKNYGLHLMVIYSNIKDLLNFYTMFSKKVLQEYDGVVIIASFYEPVESIRTAISKDIKPVDMARYEQDKSLTILDASQLYSTPQGAVDYITNMAKYAKSIGKKGVNVLGDMGAFYKREKEKGHPNSITDYEISFLPKEFSVDRKGFCMYYEKDLDKMSAEETLGLYEQHGMVIQLKDSSSHC